MLTPSFVPAWPSGRKLALATLVVLATHLAGTARAQEDAASVERARTLFTDGVALAQEQRFEEAEAHFREALTLRDAPTIRYNLASVLFEQGEFAEANELARVLLASADTPDPVRTPTAALSAQIQEASGLVLFQLPSSLAGGTLSVDDVAVADASRAVALAPGHHVARVERDGTEVGTAEVDAVAGERTTVDVTPSLGGVGARPLTEEWWFWTSIAGGVVLVAVIIGVSAGVASSQTEAPVQGNFTPAVITWP
jgi:tetratricopeptide (TPR) repeat protein